MNLSGEAVRAFVDFFKIDIKDIYCTLGSPWVPADVIDDFILHLVAIVRHSTSANSKKIYD